MDGRSGGSAEAFRHIAFFINRPHWWGTEDRRQPTPYAPSLVDLGKQKMRLRITRSVAVATAILTIAYAHMASPQDNAAPPASVQKKTAPAASHQNKTAAPASNQNNVAASPANQYKTAAGFWQQ